MKNIKQFIKFNLVDWQWKRDHKRAQPKCTDKNETVDLEKIKRFNDIVKVSVIYDVILLLYSI